MKTEVEKSPEQKIPSSAGSHKVGWVVFFFSVIIGCLASGYYFFALRLTEMECARKLSLDTITHLKKEMEHNQQELDEVRVALDFLKDQQTRTGGIEFIRGIAKMAEVSLIARDFQTTLALLDKVKEELKDQQLNELKAVLDRDYERIYLFKELPYFRLGEDLLKMEHRLEQMPSLAVKPTDTGIPKIKGDTMSWWSTIIAALKQLVKVEKITYDLILPSERNLWYLQAITALKEAKVAWLTNNLSQYCSAMRELREYINRHYGSHPWGKEILEELDRLLLVEFPEMQSLEIVKSLRNGARI